MEKRKMPEAIFPGRDKSESAGAPRMGRSFLELYDPKPGSHGPVVGERPAFTEQNWETHTVKAEKSQGRKDNGFSLSGGLVAGLLVIDVSMIFMAALDAAFIIPAIFASAMSAFAVGAAAAFVKYMRVEAV